MNIIEGENDLFFFKRSPLQELAKRYHKEYVNADPFPHVVIDDFLPEQILNRVLEDFSKTDGEGWIRRPKNHKYQQNKIKNYDEETMGPVVRNILCQFNSATFMSFLEELTEITGLIADPYYWGGGLHQIERGGFLKIHIDFNRHEHLNLDRRINLILYLNKDWEESYGGHLELWDKKMTKCIKKLLPIFNRCVIFNTNDFSFHGHPDPLNCPEGRSRKSLALYYYSNGRPASERSDKYRTTYKLRPGESPYIPPH